MTRLREAVNPRKDMLAYMYQRMSDEEGGVVFLDMRTQKIRLTTSFAKRSVGLCAYCYEDHGGNYCHTTVIYKDDHPELFEDTVESHENLCEEIIRRFAEITASVSFVNKN
jgi:hypothetical protein